MRSKLIAPALLEDFIGDAKWRPETDEEEIEKQTEQFRLGYREYRAQQTVESGDIADLELTSEEPFFNRRIKINVGKGLFDKELEKALLGKRLGETYTVAHSSEGDISVFVKDIQRLWVPPLSDELVERAGLEGIHNAEEYKRSIRLENLKKNARETAYDCLNGMIAESVFELDGDEVSFLIESEMERCRRIAEEQGEVFDDFDSEKLMGAVGQPTIEDFRRMLNEMLREQLSSSLLYLYWQGKDSESQQLTPELINGLSYDAVLYLAEKIADNTEV